MSRLPRNRHGFTLLELLVILLIIGVLATIAMATYPQMRVRAGDAAATSDLKNTAHFQEEYYATNEIYASQAVVDSALTMTENVTLTVLSAGPAGYEMSATHSASPVTFCLSSTVGAVEHC